MICLIEKLSKRNGSWSLLIINFYKSNYGFFLEHCISILKVYYFPFVQHVFQFLFYLGDIIVISGIELTLHHLLKHVLTPITSLLHNCYLCP